MSSAGIHKSSSWFASGTGKYNRAVSLTRKLDRIYPERKYTVEVAGEHVKRMQAAYNRYLVGKFKAQGKAALFKAGEMLAGGFRSLSQNVRFAV